MLICFFHDDVSFHITKLKHNLTSTTLSIFCHLVTVIETKGVIDHFIEEGSVSDTLW